MAAAIRQVPCPAGCYAGVAGIVTRDMAHDAGDLSLEGQEMSCGTCGGDGFVREEAEEPQGQDSRSRNQEGS